MRRLKLIQTNTFRRQGQHTLPNLDHDTSTSLQLDYLVPRWTDSYAGADAATGSGVDTCTVMDTWYLIPDT
jgi:hypothetical protein